MKLIVGLGNPGKKYENTRHNAGRFVEEIVSAELKVPLTKLSSFMNESGQRLRELMRRKKCQPSDLLISHDDLDLPLGSFKLQLGKGPRQHNGVLSVEAELGTKEFWRLRVGINSRSKVKGQRSKVSGEKYVLQNFTEEEKTVLKTLIKEKVVPEVENWLSRIEPRP